MKWKIVVFGGLAAYASTWIFGMVSGMLIHQGTLEETYQATAMFWRPELRMEPPDMVALLPIWIPTGLFFTLLVAGIYSVVRGSLSGPGWRRGLVFGLGLGVLVSTVYVSLFGLFDLPLSIWLWWSVDAIYLWCVCGTILGAVSQKVAPVE